MGWNGPGTLPEGGGGGGVNSVTGTAVTGGTASDPVVSPTSADIPDSSTAGGPSTEDSLNMISMDLTNVNQALAELASATNPEGATGFFGTGQTVDNTSVLIASFGTTPDASGDFVVTLSGSRSVGGDAEWSRTRLGRYKNVAGTVTLLGLGTVATARDPFVGGINVIIVANAGNIEVYANGNNGQTWDWTAYGSRT